jgi:AMIN domain
LGLAPYISEPGRRFQIAAVFCLAMGMRMPTRVFKAVSVSILLLAASGLMLQRGAALASGSPKAAPLVRGISIHHAPDGTVTIDISLTGPVPYRTMQLSGPDRLVVDLPGALQTDLKDKYPAQSPLLKRVRAGQWKYFPPVFRVVADLKGNPASSVKAMASGIRIELKPRGAAVASNHKSGAQPAEQTIDALEHERQAAQEDPPPNRVFQVHRYKDLSASLTAPVLPPHDRLVPVADPDPPKPSRKKANTLASVSSISIQPNDHGETTIDIASSRSVPYRVFQLADPFRLVIDLKDARNTSSRDVYPVNSPVLKSVRVGQWQSGNPAVVRVVADLEGYPIFDVHAQRPGIRVELRPRQKQPRVERNPFEFKTSLQTARAPSQAPPKQADLLASAPGGSLSNLSVIGFIEKKGAGTQAVISDHSIVYLVAKGGKFEDIYTVVDILPNAVVVQDMETRQKRWIAYTP